MGAGGEGWQWHGAGGGYWVASASRVVGTQRGEKMGADILGGVEGLFVQFKAVNRDVAGNDEGMVLMERAEMAWEVGVMKSSCVQ